MKDETYFKMAALAAMQALITNNPAHANDPDELGAWCAHIAAGLTDQVTRHLTGEQHD